MLLTLYVCIKILAFLTNKILSSVNRCFTSSFLIWLLLFLFLTNCYGYIMNQMLPPKFICWSPNPWSSDIWEVIWSWGWSPHECNAYPYFLQNAQERFSLSFSQQCEEAICKPEIDFSSGCKLPLILDFPDSRAMRNKCLLFKQLDLWYSALAAQTEKKKN